jgi:hypothetical protein
MKKIRSLGMRFIFLLIISSFVPVILAQNTTFFIGERLEYKIKYGFVGMAEGSLEVRALLDPYMGKPVIHLVATGRTAPMADVFVKMRNRYDSYIDTNTLLPVLYQENVKEGSYTRNGYLVFQRDDSVVFDHKGKNFEIGPETVDIISYFYKFRTIFAESLKIDSIYSNSCFLMDELFEVSFRFLGTDKIRTKFGRVECLVIQPIIPAGSIFVDDENARIWITNDKNKVPVKVKIELLFGSITAVLTEYDGLLNGSLLDD